MSPEGALAGKRVLVLDGNTRAALAVVRSLGRAKLDVSVAAPTKRSLAAVSRSARFSFCSPNPFAQSAAYRDWLLRLVDRLRPDFLLPVTNISLELALSVEDELRTKTILPFVSRDTFERVADKDRLIRLANELGVKTPRTLLLRSESDLNLPELAGFTFPAVLKPLSSELIVEEQEEVLRGKVYYLNSVEAVRETLRRDWAKFGHQLPYLLQERIEGHGLGVFILALNGEQLTYFSHRRLLEKPPSGGVSVLSESIEPPEEALKASMKLLEHLRWTGVAMVEFKETVGGTLFLMEINPRFWGSLQLAIDAGADFPRFLLELFQSRTPLRGPELDSFKRELSPYVRGLRLRWSLGTVDHALSLLRHSPIQAFASIFRRNSLQFLSSKRTTFETFRRADPAPFFFELLVYLRDEIFRSLPRRFRRGN